MRKNLFVLLIGALLFAASCGPGPNPWDNVGNNDAGSADGGDESHDQIIFLDSGYGMFVTYNLTQQIAQCRNSHPYYTERAQFYSANDIRQKFPPMLDDVLKPKEVHATPLVVKDEDWPVYVNFWVMVNNKWYLAVEKEFHPPKF